MDIKYIPKQIILVEYPGTVKNVQNMTKTLGGENEMFSAFKNPTKRLELRFRPEDPFCKCAHGDRFNTTNLLIKVVKKVKKCAKNESVTESNVNYRIDFLGVACTSYKFKSLSDFQILPVTFDKNKDAYRSLLPDIIPKFLHPASWLDKNTDLFIPPILFSRFDLPQTAYADSTNTNKILDNSTQQELPPNVIGRGRKRRAGYAIFATFENDDISSSAQPAALSRLSTYPLDVELKKKLDILFQERPVWSKNCLVLRLRCERIRLKYCLPCSAYYFTNGPWRALWVRFGYDPRKEKVAKQYQVMDLRINSAIPISEKKTRVSYYALPNKSTANIVRVPVINPQDLKPSFEELPDDEEEQVKLLLSCEYWPGQVPPARQLFYQLCDIHLPSVQELIHANDGKEKVCHDRDGWCELGTLEKCRELIIADISKTTNQPEKMPEN